MIFHTAYKGGRPVRLSEETRAFAEESLRGKYGDETLKTPFVTMDEVAGFGEREDYDKYDEMIRRIAERAPVRVTEREKICGAATLGAAIDHLVPAFYAGKPVFSGVSHLTCGFDRAVREGLDSYEDRIDKKTAGSGKQSRSFAPKQAIFKEPEKHPFLLSALARAVS